MAKLTFTAIQLMPVVRQTIETLAEAEEKLFIPVVLHLGNTGRSKTLYFVSRPRRVVYDPDQRQLFLGFEEPDPASLVRPGLRKNPGIDSLAPSCETRVTARVPLTLRMIRTKERPDRAIAEFDLSDMKSIHCRVAYSEREFYRRDGETTIDMVRRLHRWGERVERTDTVSVEVPESSRDYPFQKV